MSPNSVAFIFLFGLFFLVNSQDDVHKEDLLECLVHTKGRVRNFFESSYRIPLSTCNETVLVADCSSDMSFIVALTQDKQKIDFIQDRVLYGIGQGGTMEHGNITVNWGEDEMIRISMPSVDGQKMCGICIGTNYDPNEGCRMLAKRK